MTSENTTEDWLTSPEALAEAMAMVPLAEAFAKAVKAAVRAKLEEGEEIPGYKLRAGGRMTSYDAVKAAQILMDTGILTLEDIHKAMRISPTNLIPVWAEKNGMNKTEARKDITSRIKDASHTKPKSSSVVRDKK